MATNGTRRWGSDTSVRAPDVTLFDGYATACAIVSAPIYEPEEKKRMVDVYRVFVLNRETEELMSMATRVGEGEADAMVGFPLTDEMKKLKRRDKLVILTQRVGNFEKFEIQEVRVLGNGDMEDAD